MSRSRPRRPGGTPPLAVMTAPGTGVVGVTARPLGLTPEAMLVAALLVMPALWRSVVEGELPLYLALERYLLITAGCAVVSWLVHSWSESARVVRERLDRLDRRDRSTGYVVEQHEILDRPGKDPFALDPLDADPLLELGAGDPGLDTAFDAADPILADLAPLESFDEVTVPLEEEPLTGMETPAEPAARSFSLFEE
jgi:hypothetical protein